jgi:hypothetical protein
MICPQCRAEIPDGATVCPQCGANIAASPPQGDDRPDPGAKLVEIFSTGDAAMIPVVESVLDGAGIEFFAKGAEAQDLLGFGRMGTSYSDATGPVEFLVREEDEAAARAVLEQLTDPPPEDAEEPARS